MFQTALGENYLKRFAFKLSRRRIIILSIAAFFIIPFPTTIVPEQKVKAVGVNGQPIPKTVFRQSWNHNSYDFNGVEFIEADENGNVILPKRKFIAPLIYRIPRSGFAFLTTLIAHGGDGASGSVNAFTKECSSKLYTYDTDNPLPEVIVLNC